MEVIDLTSNALKSRGYALKIEDKTIALYNNGHCIRSDIYPEWNKTVKRFDEKLDKEAPEMDKLAKQDIKHCMSKSYDAFSPFMNGAEEKKKKSGSESSTESVAVVRVMKYTANKEAPQLWEAVRIKGSYCFVSYDSTTNTVLTKDKIEDYDCGSGKTLEPSDDADPEPFSFRDKAELESKIEFVRKGKHVGYLFRKVKYFVKCFYDTDIEAYTDLIAADIVFTYFQDRIGKTHYILVWGDPDTGKGAILECFNQLGYRGVSVTNDTAATIYRSLGSLEKGQVIMIIDEANKLEDDLFLLNVLKVGYKGNTKVRRVMDAQSSQFSKIEYFFAYCFKILAAEKLPSSWKTGGFRSRCFEIHTAPGNPQIDIGDVIDNAGDPKNAKTMSELAELRKLLFAYRLVHYSDPIPDIAIKGITGRDRELIKPLLRLFITHGHDDEVLDTVKDTLHYFVKGRNEDKTDSFAAYIHRLLKGLVKSDETELSFSDIWKHIEDELEGEPIPDKTDWICTPLFGDISKNRLWNTLRSLGGDSGRNPKGTVRVWKFKTKTLRRFDSVFKDIPDTIEIIKKI